MKKITATLLGTLIASSAALAQTNQVLSRNAVGYVKINVPASNSLALVSNPFVALDEGSARITNVFASLVNNSTVSVWNEASQSYLNYAKNSRGGWVGTGVTTVQFARADAAFIRSAGTSTVFFMGEVPDSTTAPTTTQSRAAGITMLGNPYPVEVAVTNSSIGLSLPAGGTISIWNSVSNKYDNFAKNSRGAWVGTITATIKPGDGLVIRATNATANFSTTKPYNWP